METFEFFGETGGNFLSENKELWIPLLFANISLKQNDQ